MAIVHLPRSLSSMFPEAPRLLELEARSVEELLRGLDRRWPGMWDRLCETGPRVREHVNVFVNGQRAAIDTRLESGSVVHVIPAVAGGAHF